MKGGGNLHSRLTIKKFSLFMKPVLNCDFDLSEQEALNLQKDLAKKVVISDYLGGMKLVAGCDVAYQKNSDKLVASIVVLDVETLQVIETSTAEDICQFPYIPGLFSFRELPPLIKAFDKLKYIPDVVVCDGQGLAHPRRFGLACHLGVVFDIPTIGCGKSRLIGEYQEPAAERGGYSPLIDNSEEVGCVLRTQTGVKPVFVSIGHRVSLATARHLILKLSPEYRLPETTRQADHLVKIKLKNYQLSESL